MKKITLLMALMISSLGFSQKYLPLTFTNANQLMTGSDASVATLVPDPLDAANQVVQIVGDATQQWDQASLALSTSVNLSDDANNTITFRINPVGVTGTHNHLLKFEGNGQVEFWFTTTGSGWQTITADFAAGLVNYPKILIFTDAGSADTGTYLVDDIMGATNLPLTGGVFLPFAFSDPNQLMTGQGGTATSLVSDPSDGTNQVMQIVGGVDTWDNAIITLNPSVNLQNDANNTITFRINPIGITGIRQHLLKFEAPGAVEHFFTTTDSGWQTITVDYPAGLVAYSSLVIFTDSGAASNGYNNANTGTYLIDDIMGATNNPLTGGVTLPLTFSASSELFTGNGVTTSLVPDPLDSTNQVMQIDGSVGDAWNNALLSINPGVDLSNDANNTITFRINPIGVTGIHSHLLKFQDAGAAEYWFDTNGSGWQTISADFPAGLVTYPTIVIFPDAGSLGTGTYLVDDIKFASALSTAKFDTASIKMYPNPVKNTLTIEANSAIQKVSIYTILGQEVMTASPKSNTATLQTSELQRGVYIVRTAIDGKISTSKILKE